jgi:hypothetical protein
VAGGLSPPPRLARRRAWNDARRSDGPPGQSAAWLLLGPPSLVLTLLFVLPIG